MKRQLRTAWLAVVAGMLIIVFLALIASSYYHNILRKANGDGLEDVKAYRRHYAMIVSDSDMPFWQDVYRSTAAAAGREDALVELMGTGLSSASTMEEMLGMAIAARVDGILLEYTGGRRQDEGIRKAGEAGIPVVTVLKDAPNSDRVSFVGANSYQMGRQYGEELMKLIPQEAGPVEVMVLLHDGSSGGSQAQMVEQIHNQLATAPETAGRVTVTDTFMRSTGKVDADETIRKLFFREQGAPDILVCTEGVDSEAAYQALIDYNKVGEVQLVGYYKSPQILEAVSKGIIPVTLVIDTEQMGRYCVEALTEYWEEGRVNSFYSVDLEFVTGEDAGLMMKSE